MRAFTYISSFTDLLHDCQLACFWYRSWKDAGFTPQVLTAADLDGNQEEIIKAAKRAGCPPHLFLRWWAVPEVHCLMVEPTILPRTTADRLKEEFKLPMRFSAQNSSVFGVCKPSEVRGALTSEWPKKLLLPCTDADIVPAVNDRLAHKIVVGDFTRYELDADVDKALFVEYTVERLIAMRAERIGPIAELQPQNFRTLLPA